jgi:lysophospholipase L1-like esterase
MHARARAVAVVVALAALLGGWAASASAAAPPHGDRGYLALGDSVAFGTDPTKSPTDASNFAGYPELLARALGLDLVNASCPGEATGGFISPTGTDNVCRPYRLAFPLHVAYAGTQLDFAVGYLERHPRTRLVTLGLGANDLFVCQKVTPDGCRSPAEIAATAATVRTNLTTIVRRLRAVYRHRLVLVTYYARDYRDPVEVAAIGAVNQAIVGAARAGRARVASGFGAFALAAAPRGGDACAAGLLIRLPAGGCDVHPSPRGDALLAAAVLAARPAQVSARHPDHRRAERTGAGG